MRSDLPQDRVPIAWFNPLTRLPAPMPPPLHPGTNEPIGPGEVLDVLRDDSTTSD